MSVTILKHKNQDLSYLRSLSVGFKFTIREFFFDFHLGFLRRLIESPRGILFNECLHLSDTTTSKVLELGLWLDWTRTSCPQTEVVNLECQLFRQQRMQNSTSISSKNVNRFNVFTQAGLTTYKYTEFLKNLYRLKFSSSLWSSMNFLNILWKTSQPYIISYICRFSNLHTSFSSPENILL